MRKMMMFAIAIFCVAWATLVTPVSAHASVLGETQITFERAIGIAIGRTGGGILKEIEWKRGRRGPVYEAEMYHNGQKHEITINAVTGEITRHKSKRSKSHQALIGLTDSEVTSVRAIQLAEAAIARIGGGTVREIIWEYKYGMLVCEVEVNNNGRKYEIKFNAATGEIIEID